MPKAEVQLPMSLIEEAESFSSAMEKDGLVVSIQGNKLIAEDGAGSVEEIFTSDIIDQMEDLGITSAIVW